MNANLDFLGMEGSSEELSLRSPSGATGCEHAIAKNAELPNVERLAVAVGVRDKNVLDQWRIGDAQSHCSADREVERRPMLSIAIAHLG